MYGYIYRTINLINGKKYIGQHKCDHFELKSYLGSGKLLLEAIKKHGRRNFKTELLTSINNVPTICESKEELNFAEKYYIEYYKCTEDPSYYNCVKGGQEDFFRDCHHTSTSKTIISKASSNRRWITDGCKNKFVKDDQLDAFLKNNWRLGRIRDISYKNDPNIRKKISEKKLGKKYYTDGQTVKMLSLDEYESKYKRLGYRPGSRKSSNIIIYKDLLITNGVEVRSTNSSQISSYLSKGWSTYPCNMEAAKNKFTEYSSNLAEKLSNERRNNFRRYFETESPSKRASRIQKIKIARAKQINVNHLGVKGKIWIYNSATDIRKAITKEELEGYLAKGWTKGVSPKTSQTLIAYNANRTITETTRRRLSESHKGQQIDNRWINNGEITKRVNKLLVDVYLSAGWSLGRIRRVK